MLDIQTNTKDRQSIEGGLNMGGRQRSSLDGRLSMSSVEGTLVGGRRLSQGRPEDEMSQLLTEFPEVRNGLIENVVTDRFVYVYVYMYIWMDLLWEGGGSLTGVLRMK